jgi:hypothetical protein
MDSDTVLIEISFNDISILANGIFDNMPLLETIVLNDNGIHTVGPGVFNGLLSLRRIDLRNNNINSLHPSVFQYNPNLTILDLSCNDLKRLRLDFSYNTELKFLNLSGNMFTREDLSTLRPLIHLQVLDLSNNRLENLSAETFDVMLDLKYLNVSGNSQLEYDCRLRTLWILCLTENITCVTDDQQSFKMVDNLHCATEEEPMTMSLTDESDGFIAVSESMAESSTSEGSGVESTEIFVETGVKEFNSTDKAFIQPTITPNGDWILITIIVVSICCLVAVIVVAVICIRRLRKSREETSGNLSRTHSIDYLNQQDQFSRKYKNSRSDSNKNHNYFDRVIQPDFGNSVLQFKVGSTVATEVVRVPSFKTRVVTTPLNLPEEIPLRETPFNVESKGDECPLKNQSSGDSVSRSDRVFPCGEDEALRLESVKSSEYPESSTIDHLYAKPGIRKQLAPRLS